MSLCCFTLLHVCICASSIPLSLRHGINTQSGEYNAHCPGWGRKWGPCSLSSIQRMCQCSSCPSYLAYRESNPGDSLVVW